MVQEERVFESKVRPISFRECLWTLTKKVTLTVQIAADSFSVVLFRDMMKKAAQFFSQKTWSYFQVVKWRVPGVYLWVLKWHR